MRLSASQENLLEASPDAEKGFSSEALDSPGFAPPYRPLKAARSRRATWLIALLFILLVVSLADSYALRRPLSNKSASQSCSADAFNSGSWQRKQGQMHVTDKQSYLAAAGFEGCAGENYYFADGSGNWSHFDEPMSWEWQPGDACSLVRPSMRERLQNLVDEGSLLLVGDSLSYQHFYSISCQLYPHVRWGNESINPKAERIGLHDGLQHLYLDLSSPLVKSLKLPSSFDADVRPVVSFIAAYVPVSPPDEMRGVENINQEHVPANYEDNKTFDALYRIRSSIAIDLFMRSSASYRTMFVNFGAHINDYIFPGADWVDLQEMLRAATRMFYRNVQQRMSKDQRVIFRATTPGHDWIDQHYDGPLAEMPKTGGWFQWAAMPSFNSLFRQEIDRLQDSRFFWMDGERIARTRPDAHVVGEGLHWAYGTGVMETFSMYMWHLLATQ